MAVSIAKNVRLGSSALCDSFRRGQQNELSAAILFPGRFIVAYDNWTIFAVANGLNAIRSNSKIAHEFFTQRQIPAVCQRAIVLFGAAFVTVAFDPDRAGWIAFQVGGHRLHFQSFGGRYCRAVILKVNGVGREQ